MTQVTQAFAISDEDKRTAELFYKDAVALLVNKKYVTGIDDGHTELSAIFGVRWVSTQRGSGAFWGDAKIYADANNAFNYANSVLGMNGKFVALAKQLVTADERISDAQLKRWDKQMNCLLTRTNAEDFKEYFGMH